MNEQAEERKESLTKPLKAQKVKDPPGWVFMVLAVIFPLFVIGFELYTNMCAEAFFDPMPTVFHKLLVLFVPCSNLLIWWRLRSESSYNAGLLLLLTAVSIGIASYYTIIFLPIIPVSLVGIIFYGLGLLPFAPLVSLVSASKLYNRLKDKHEKEVGNRSYLLKGISIALLALVLLDIPSAATYFGVNWATSDSGDTRERGIRLLRSFGDKDLLLRLSYDGSRRATGMLSFGALMASDRDFIPSAKAREVFYQVTGEPFM